MKSENRVLFAILPIAIILTLFAFSSASTVVLWVLCAFFLFAVVDPLMERFMGLGVPPILLSIGLVLIGSAMAAGMGFLIFKTSSGVIVQLISYKAAIYKFYQNTFHELTHYTQFFSHQSYPTAGQDAAAQATTVPGPSGSTPDVSEMGMGVLSGLNSVVSVLSFMVLTPLLTFFMLAERNLFAVVCTPLFSSPEKGRKMWKQITDATTAFFLGNFVLILVSFPIFVVAFWLLGVKAFLSMGLLSAIFNLVPFLGFVLAAILPTLDLLMNGGHVGGAIILVSLCFVTHFSIANVVTPKILGAKLNLNATVSTIALIGWGELWGPMGLLLAIPLTALIKVLLEHSSLEAFQTASALMSEDALTTSRLRLKKINGKRLN
jgi:predicted PurR-regulated permease PerM